MICPLGYSALLLIAAIGLFLSVQVILIRVSFAEFIISRPS